MKATLIVLLVAVFALVNAKVLFKETFDSDSNWTQVKKIFFFILFVILFVFFSCST